jgi:DNA-binding MarR family transcriptional regulator
MTAVSKRVRKPTRRVRASTTASSPHTALELQTLQSLRTIFGSARTHDAELRRSAGVSGSQLWALSEVARSNNKQGITVNQLSAQMALHQTTTSNLVNSLVEKGLIRRQRDAADQRVVHLCATAQGKQLLLRTPGPHAGLLVDALRSLDRAHLHRLSESLGWVLTRMRRTADLAAGETLMGE